MVAMVTCLRSRVADSAVRVDEQRRVQAGNHLDHDELDQGRGDDLHTQVPGMAAGVGVPQIRRSVDSDVTSSGVKCSCDNLRHVRVHCSPRLPVYRLCFRPNTMEVKRG